MSVGRNDPCPCGSGKKYNSCCLKNEDQKRSEEQRRENFYKAKQELVENIGDFLAQQVPVEHYDLLKDEFKERTNHSIDKEIEESYFTFWLFFFYQFENELRGIEWFYEAYKSKLSPQELAMTESWMEMRPQLLKAVDIDNTFATFVDVHSGKTFPVSLHEENLKSFYPWVCTIAFLEFFEGLYYFNGLRYSVSPYALENVIKRIETLGKETGLTGEKVLENYFPEIIVALLEPVTDDSGNSEVAEYYLVYTLHNSVIVSEYLRSEEDIRVELWEHDKKQFTWTGNWRVYKDNAAPGNITLADAYGNLFLQEDTLMFVGIEEEYQQAMKARLEQLGNVLTLEREEKKVIGDTMPKPNSTIALADQEVPEHFIFFAQNELPKQADEPIPLYNNQTLRELVVNGQQKEALKWLENLEYNVYRHVNDQFEELDVTVDFNALRKEINLPLSPFVTGGADRKSTFETIDITLGESRLYKADIPFLEAIGFTPDTSKNFYTADLLRYFKERMSTQTEEEAEKTATALFDFRELLEQSNITDWQPEALDFWKTLLSELYKELPEYTEEKHQYFLWEIETFFTWIANRDKNAYKALCLLISEKIKESE